MPRTRPVTIQGQTFTIASLTMDEVIDLTEEELPVGDAKSMKIAARERIWRTTLTGLNNALAPSPPVFTKEGLAADLTNAVGAGDAWEVLIKLHDEVCKISSLRTRTVGEIKAVSDVESSSLSDAA